jgi:GTP-binding protein
MARLRRRRTVFPTVHQRASGARRAVALRPPFRNCVHMSRPLHVEFLGDATEVGRLPSTQAEIAFVGRSNVGKSSLLNALAGQKRLAHVSSTPGRTQLLTCFALPELRATLVDCPGYGYARVAKTKRAEWLPMVEDYLLEREQLAMALLLVDGEIGPMRSDLEMLAWLRDNDVPHTVVATKHDKVKPSQRGKRQIEVGAACGVAPEAVLWVSAERDHGIGSLRESVRHWLA